MNIKEISILIRKLTEENKTNTSQEKEFNNRWINILINNIKNGNNKRQNN